MNQQELHQTVIEHLTGARHQRDASHGVIRLAFIITLSAAVIIFVLSMLTDRFDAPALGIIVGLLIASIPFGALAQRATMHISHRAKHLRLKRFLIGKKEYLAPKNQVRHQEIDLFAVAASLACNEPYIATTRHAAAWHSYQVIEDLPGVGVLVGWFGDSKHPYAFMYGDHKTILEHSHEIWDLGHVRKLSDKDRTLATETAKSWRRQRLLPIALAYAPLSEADTHSTLSARHLSDNSTLVGLIGVQGSREYGNTYDLASREAVRASSNASAAVSIGLSLFSLTVFVLSLVLNLPLAFGFWAIVFSKLLVETLPVATFSWDENAPRRKHAAALEAAHSLFAGFSLAVVSLVSYLLYLGYNGGLTQASNSTSQRTATAIAALTFGLSIIALIGLSRNYSKLQDRLQLKNPLYALGSASALLIALIVGYSHGPILFDGLVLALSSTGLFVLLLEVRLYAETHHSRESIIALLQK